MRQLIVLPALLAGVGGLISPASAHHRDFTFIRDWYLPYPGEREIESRTQYIAKDRNWTQEFEFEMGITNNFAIEPGFAYHREGDEDWHLDEWDVELRFNFLQFKPNTVLPALNVEYEHPTDPDEAQHGELKFIFSYYTPTGEDYSLNLNVGQELNKDKEKESEAVFGYVRQLSKPEKDSDRGYLLGWRGGFESVFDFQEHNFWIGPTLIYRSNKHLNSLLTYLIPTGTHKNAESMLKLIMEWEY